MMDNINKIYNCDCYWHDDVIKYMQSKGYEFDGMVGTNTHPYTFRFHKTKSIVRRNSVGEEFNAFREFRCDVSVNQYNNKIPQDTFNANCRLELCDYTRNEQGNIDGYYGDTIIASCSIYYWVNGTDKHIKNLHFSRI